MSKSEVRALQPKKVVPLTEECFAVLDWDYKDGGVNRLDMEWYSKDKGDQCGIVVSQTLFAKYGEPDKTQRDVETNDCGNSYAGGFMGALSMLCEGMGGDEPDYIGYAQWVRDGIEITLKRDTGDEHSWYLTYRPAVIASEDAASKL